MSKLVSFIDDISVNGVKLYEAIVDEKILETAQNQISHLEKVSEQLITEETIPPQSAEIKEIQKQAEEKIEEKKEKVEKQLDDIKKDEEIVKQNPEEVLSDKTNITTQKIEEEKEEPKEKEESKEKYEK